MQKVEKLEEAAVAMGEDREDEEGRVSIDDARDGVCVIDGDGIITVANAHVARMFG